MNKFSQYVTGLLVVAAGFNVRAEVKIPNEYKSGQFFIGCQAYSFNRYTVFEAIEKTAQTGSKVIEFYPGQKLSKDEPKVVWDHNASDDTIVKVLRDSGVDIARRTVAKYREAMRIPSSVQRRREKQAN